MEGKQVNRSQSGSWEGRCAGAGLRQNLGPEWPTTVWKSVTGEDPNSVFQEYLAENSKKVRMDKKRKATDQAKKNRNQSKYRKTNDNSLKARNDYARHDGGSDVLAVREDVSSECLQRRMKEYYETHVVITAEDMEMIEVLTRNQSQGDCEIASNKWKAERRKRLTSSIIGQVARRRSTTKVAKLVKTLLYSSFTENTATNWGLSQEQVTRKEYLKKKSQSSVQPSGLVISLQFPWIAASPDGLVTDPSLENPPGLVEYNNPYKYRNIELTEAAKSKDFCLQTSPTGELHLKTNHFYYYQVQGAMFCTGRKWCDIVVRTLVDFHIEKIYWNEDLWSEIFPKLQRFYITAVLPELARPRLQHGGIREPKKWLTNVEEEWESLI